MDQKVPFQEEVLNALRKLSTAVESHRTEVQSLSASHTKLSSEVRSLSASHTAPS